MLQTSRLANPAQALQCILKQRIDTTKSVVQGTVRAFDIKYSLTTDASRIFEVKLDVMTTSKRFATNTGIRALDRLILLLLTLSLVVSAEARAQSKGQSTVELRGSVFA